MCDKSNNNTQSTADYLAQLINDRKQVTAFPNVFMHVERLIDEEHVSSTLALGYKKLYTPYSIPLEPLSSMLFNLALRIEKNV
ncbi:hypothetical protein M8J76_010306 [Diaphorina citri]|nr:hypothetical protein M8J76_010306 [Diaphorina citri]